MGTFSIPQQQWRHNITDIPEIISCLVMATILRLPHMDIVIDDEKMNVSDETSTDDKTRRRSDRLRKIQTSEERSMKRRRRYNSVMDDDEDEENQDDEKNNKRKEPAHRHLNRLRLKQRQEVEPVSSPEDNPLFSEQVSDASADWLTQTILTSDWLTQTTNQC